jgi:hypothetical protein
MLLTACYQKLSPWLYSPLDRRGRAYLESHLDLLDAESDEFLELFIAEYKEKPEEQRRLRLARHILRDASERGRTTEAVRDTYINVFGGLILDPPAWLQEIEQQWMPRLAEPWTERRAALGKLQLRGAIERAQLDLTISPTIGAELQFLLGNLFANDLLKRPADTFETIVDCYTAALQVYSIERYPLRRAKILLTLGDVYRRQATDQHADLLLQATYYYGQALGIYNTCEPV